METLLERLLFELAVIAIELGIAWIARWFQTRRPAVAQAALPA